MNHRYKYSMHSVLKSISQEIKDELPMCWWENGLMNIWKKEEKPTYNLHNGEIQEIEKDNKYDPIGLN